MAKLSISAAWNEAAAFVKQEAGTLFLIAFGLMALPGIILQFLLPRWLPMGPMSAGPGMTPDPSVFLAALPWFLAAIIPILLVSIWGNLVINILALRRESVVGAAFAHAGRRILPLLGALLVLMIAACILIIPMVAMAFTGIRTGHVGWIVLLFFLAWLALLFIWIRLVLIVPVAAAENEGPIAIIRRSWTLTAGHFWKLLGFFLLLVIVVLVVSLVVGAIGGILIVLVAGRPEAGSVAALLVALLNGIVQAIWTVYFIATIARIYAQLTGGGVGVADVFE
jgi:hypothetical protein